ncbi:MAG: NAD(P)/FAD-dependent oxidoreductase [Lachnospiraceae bacterium]|nr:NAD(P)/FAD-dependent oxidoreductase [Lachnospiraceae bacterium]
MYDVTIIGAGISGCSLAYELSKYNVNALLLEKENDVSVGTTKANSAIVHAGYDPEPGSKMAKYNVAGNAYTAELCEKLDVPFKKIGSLVVAFSDDEMKTIQDLYERGNVNGCPGLEVWDQAKLKAEEPNLSEEAKGALYAPTAGVVSPWELAIALAEVAVKNGVEVKLNTEVTNIDKTADGYKIETNQGDIETKYVVNCAGVFADKVNEYVNESKFTIVPNKGEYYLLDKSQGDLVNHVIFQCPNEKGKGVLVSPTVHGNLIVGPNSIPTDDDDLATTLDGLEFVRTAALKSVPTINYRESIRNFAGLRARTAVHDFFIYEDEVNKGFFNMAGMASPGLTSACAISVDMVQMIGNAGLALSKKDDFDEERKVVRFKHMSNEERAELVKKNPLYGKIICRCETVTEGEIVDALHRPIVPTSVDGIKRRCNAGMGRCQGGFCGPRVQEIIARELGIAQEEVMKDRAGMKIILGETKEVGGAN